MPPEPPALGGSESRRRASWAGGRSGSLAPLALPSHAPRAPALGGSESRRRASWAGGRSGSLAPVGAAEGDGPGQRVAHLDDLDVAGQEPQEGRARPVLQVARRVAPVGPVLPAG